MNNNKWTYSKVGINTKKIRKSQNEIGRVLGQTFINREGKIGSVLFEIGHYAGLIDIGRGTALALHVDGVGTKVLISQIMNRYDTIGIDCVAMNVNDIICVGAEPIALLDYIALKELDENILNEIIKGLKTGADEASIAIIGGETAIMPDVIEGMGNKAFDIVGMIVGIVSKRNIITGKNIKEGDIIIGIESSGIHSNGLSLARKVLFSKYKANEYVKELDNVLGNELLKPTRIYVKPVMDILRRKIYISGLANITGGSFSKLTRLIDKSVGFRLDNYPKIPPIFNLIQNEGGISKREMFRTFNMGIGFCLITSRNEVENINNIFSTYNMNIHVIGRVIKKYGVYINNLRIDN